MKISYRKPWFSVDEAQQLEYFDTTYDCQQNQYLRTGDVYAVVYVYVARHVVDIFGITIVVRCKPAHFFCRFRTLISKI